MLKRKWIRIGLTALPAVLLLAAILLRDNAVYLAEEVIPPCNTYELLGIFCPGCGLTRCMLALMHGNVWLAFRCNAVVVLLLLALVLLYAERVLWCFGRDVRILPRMGWFWICFGICAAGYFVLRNFVPELSPPSLNL
ncbi:MAG: DUF2752 domain-containing protein [Ruminococcus sp.]|nr:DUF2752 domain-containing protein [Ruminococcus sp.]